MVSVELIMEYSRVFPSEPFNLEKLLSGIDPIFILKVATTLVNSDLRKKTWEDVFPVWFSDSNQYFVNYLKNRIEEEFIAKGEPPKIIVTSSSLKLLQLALSMRDMEVTNRKSSEQVEIDLFKIYLYLNEEVGKRSESSSVYMREKYESIYVATLLLMMGFPASELETFNGSNEFFCQVVKALIFFDFAQKNSKLKQHNDRFLQKYRLNDFKGYFTRIVPFIDRLKGNIDKGFIEVYPGSGLDSHETLLTLNQLSVQSYIPDDDIDFKIVRSSPLVKIEGDKFRMTHPLFIIDKVFKSLFFDYSAINSSLEKGISDFRSFYTTYFSEQCLLYSILEYGVRMRCIRFRGIDFSDRNLQGYSDYYLRSGKYLFLFENKDALIASHIKEKGHFPDLESAFRKKFLEDNGTPIGVGQLVNNIIRALKRGNELDKEYKEGNLVIYPVLVVHDIMYDCPGFNCLLNDWMQKELIARGLGHGDLRRVKDLTVLNINTLICVAGLMNSGKESLKSVLDTYIDYVQTPISQVRHQRDFERQYTSKYLSSSNIIHAKMSKKYGPNFLQQNSILKHWLVSSLGIQD